MEDLRKALEESRAMASAINIPGEVSNPNRVGLSPGQAANEPPEATSLGDVLEENCDEVSSLDIVVLGTGRGNEGDGGIGDQQNGQTLGVLTLEDNGMQSTLASGLQMSGIAMRLGGGGIQLSLSPGSPSTRLDGVHGHNGLSPAGNNYAMKVPQRGIERPAGDDPAEPVEEPRQRAMARRFQSAHRSRREREKANIAELEAPVLELRDLGTPGLPSTRLDGVHGLNGLSLAGNNYPMEVPQRGIEWSAEPQIPVLVNHLIIDNLIEELARRIDSIEEEVRRLNLDQDQIVLRRRLIRLEEQQKLEAKSAKSKVRDLRRTESVPDNWYPIS